MFLYDSNMMREEEEDEEGDAVDMTQREAEEDDGGKVHEIKFDAYGIMDDGVDESTEEQLAKLKSAGGSSSASDATAMINGVASSSTVVEGATAETGPIDEDLFDDEDLD